MTQDLKANFSISFNEGVFTLENKSTLNEFPHTQITWGVIPTTFPLKKNGRPLLAPPTRCDSKQKITCSKNFGKDVYFDMRPRFDGEMIFLVEAITGSGKKAIKSYKGIKTNEAGEILQEFDHSQCLASRFNQYINDGLAEENQQIQNMLLSEALDAYQKSLKPSLMTREEIAVAIDKIILDSSVEKLSASIRLNFVRIKFNSLYKGKADAKLVTEVAVEKLSNL